MTKTLTEIAQKLKDGNKKVQLIYAFNGSGKTRLSRAFKHLIAPKTSVEGTGNLSDAVDPDKDEVAEANNAATGLSRDRILYYNAFTEDLFYWDNDLALDGDPRLKIQPNSFTDWILKDQGPPFLQRPL